MPSSVVARFSYDADSQVLKVIFVSGLVYEYQHVPESVYDAMKRSRSKGSFLNRKIKGVYDFIKVN